MFNSVQELRTTERFDSLLESFPARSFLMQLAPVQPGAGLVELDLSRTTMIGRDPRCDIPLNDEFVSAEHAILEWDEAMGAWTLTDLNSRNGTLVNDRRCEHCLLQPDDRIRIGRHILKFMAGDDPRAAFEATAYEISTTDSLTQVCNRRLFELSLDRELQRALRFGRHLAVMLIEVDRFRAIVADEGPLAADEVLQGICARIRRRVRRDELFARFREDTFAMVLVETPRSQVELLADEVRRIIAREPLPTVHGDVAVAVHTRVGHTMGLEPLNVRELIGRAENAVSSLWQEMQSTTLTHALIS